MNKILVATISLFWVTAVYGSDLGEGAVGQSSWVGKSPEYFLTTLPAPPGTGCPCDGEVINSFRDKFLQAQKELKDEVGKRRRALKKWNEQNSRNMMENAVDMPGFQGKSQSEMKKMTKAERKAMAEKTMQDKFGVSMEDIKNQKKANDSGKVMANVDFAKTMSGEMQANDLMKSKGQRDADKKKIRDTGKLVKEQANLSQQLHATVIAKSLTMLEELAQDEQRKKLLEKVYDEIEVGAKMRGTYYKRPKEIDFKKMAEIIRRAAATGGDAANIDLAAEMGYGKEPPPPPPGYPQTPCEELNAQGDKIYMQRLVYCKYTAGKFLEIVREFQRALTTSQTRYRMLDQINSDLQKAQTGIGLPDAAMGLSGLEAIQQYVALLGQVYAHDPGKKRDPNDAGACGGAQF